MIRSRPAATALVVALLAGGAAGAWALVREGGRAASAATGEVRGGAADDALWSSGQGERLVGGRGDDTYYLKSGADRVIEAKGGGIDLIAAWHSIDLSDHPHVENLRIAGEAVFGAGNALDNVIESSNSGQQLYGGLGQDVLVGWGGADVFIVVKGEGNDVIQDFNPAEDKVRLKAGLFSFDQVQQRLSQVGADVRLDLGGGDGLMFRNLQVGQLTASNFQLEINPAAFGPATFAEEFNGPISFWDEAHAPAGRWRTDFGYQGSNGVGSYTLTSNGEKQIYTSPYFRDHPGDFAETPFAFNADGTMSIWARPSNSPEIFGYQYTSGLITTRPSFSQTYGYFEMRADMPEVAGAWTAFWLLPTDWSWPPELDIVETLGWDQTNAWTTAHSSVGGHTQSGGAQFIPSHASGMHTYGALWSPTEIVWYVDGLEVNRTETPADMHKPMFMLTNLSLGGWGGPVDNGALPAEMRIDYIRAYSLGAAPTPAAAAFETTLMGDAADNQLFGAVGRNYMRGGDGDDLLVGGAAFDDLHGNVGNDTVRGEDGDDWVVGGRGDDRIFGGGGADLVYGHLENDTLDGGAGNDTIRGGQHDDVIMGDDGADWMAGDRGSDTLYGGSGADSFHIWDGAGPDVVMDFNRAEGDRVVLAPGQQATVAEVGGNVVVTVGSAELTLQGVSLADLTGSWLINL